jgi:hypothetical protein
MSSICRLLQWRCRWCARNRAHSEEAPESPPTSSGDDNAPPLYTDCPSDEEVRISLGTPAGAFDILLPSAAQPPPTYSELAMYKSTNAASNIFELHDAQTILDMTKNHLDTATSSQPVQEQGLSAAVRCSLIAQTGTAMLLPGWLMRLTMLVYRRACERYNVIAVAIDKGFHLSASGVIADFLIDYDMPEAGWTTSRRASDYSDGSGSVEGTDKIAFRVVVFREGVVVKADDVGDSLWDWRGKWERVGSRVVRFRPCV